MSSGSPDYFYMRDGQRHGPVSLHELRLQMAEGRLTATGMVWQVGTPAWVQAWQVPGLVEAPPLPPAPPPEPVSMPAPRREPRRERARPSSGGGTEVGGIWHFRGTAEYVRRSVEAWADQHEAGTIQIVTFQIGSQAVEVSMGTVPQINDGDEVAVAGLIENGTLKARAYKNWSNGTHGSWTTGFNYGCNIAFGLFIIGFVFPPAMLITLLAGGIGLGVYLTTMSRTSKAISMVNDPNMG